MTIYGSVHGYEDVYNKSLQSNISFRTESSFKFNRRCLVLLMEYSMSLILSIESILKAIFLNEHRNCVPLTLIFFYNHTIADSSASSVAYERMNAAKVYFFQWNM